MWNDRTWVAHVIILSLPQYASHCQLLALSRAHVFNLWIWEYILKCTPYVNTCAEKEEIPLGPVNSFTTIDKSVST